jgi:hypothetical protein
MLLWSNREIGLSKELIVPFNRQIEHTAVVITLTLSHSQARIWQRRTSFAGSPTMNEFAIGVLTPTSTIL